MDVDIVAHVCSRTGHYLPRSICRRPCANSCRPFVKTLRPYGLRRLGDDYEASFDPYAPRRVFPWNAKRGFSKRSQGANPTSILMCHVSMLHRYVRDGLLRQNYAHMLWPQSTPCNVSKVVFWDDKSGLVLYQVYDSPRLRSDSRPSEPHRDDIKWRLASSKP